MPSRRGPAPPNGTPSSTSTAASGCCSPTPARAAGSCRTPPCWSTARWNDSARPASSSASTSTPRVAAWPCRSTRSTSRSGECWKNWPRHSSRACPPWSSRHPRPPTWPRPWSRRSSPPVCCPKAACSWSPVDHRGLLDLLTEQDTVAFTGSASTAALLKSIARSCEHGVRFSSEADSLNFSVLGVDVTPGSAEFDLYVRQLVTEMTSKAGQKCTAIRRALVPDAAGARCHRRGPSPDCGQGPGGRPDGGGCHHGCTGGPGATGRRPKESRRIGHMQRTW